MHAGIRFKVSNNDPQPEATPRPWVDKDVALLCAEFSCGAIYNADGGGCPKCGNAHGWPVARWLDEKPMQFPKPTDES